MNQPDSTPPAALAEARYHRLAASALASIESRVDAWLEADTVDIDTQRAGGLLELTFPDRSKIIVNLQPPLQELWLAARAGGFHYRWADGAWRDTRTGEEFFVALSRQASLQAGVALQFDAPATPD